MQYVRADIISYLAILASSSPSAILLFRKVSACAKSPLISTKSNGNNHQQRTAHSPDMINYSLGPPTPFEALRTR